MNSTDKTLLIWDRAFFILLSTALAALIYHPLILGQYFTAGWPASTLGETPEILANDLTRLMGTSAGFTPYADMRGFFPFEAVPYPPLTFLVHGILAKLGVLGAAALFYSIFGLGTVLLVGSLLDQLPTWRRLTGTLAFTFGTFPFLYALDRANFDAIAFLLVGAALLLETRNSSNRSSPATAALIGVAAALKIYPIVFALIYLPQRRWTQIAVVGAVALGLSLLASLFLSGSPFEQLGLFLRELRLTHVCYNVVESCQNLSFVYPLKRLARLVFGASIEHPVALRVVYLAATLGMLAALTGLIYLRRPPLAISAVLLAIAGIWIPAMSFNYKLLFISLSVLLLMRSNERSQITIATVLLFALVPKRVLGVENEMVINHALLFAGFALAALAFWGRGESSLAALERFTPSWAPAAVLAAFLLPYPIMTARAFIVPSGEPLLISAENGGQRSTFRAGWGALARDETKGWRWMQACEATVNLRLAPGPGYTLKIGAWNHADNKQQVVNVLVDGVSLGIRTMTPSEKRELEFDVPATSIARTKLLPHRLVIRTIACNPQGIAVSDLSLRPRP